MHVLPYKTVIQIGLPSLPEKNKAIKDGDWHGVMWWTDRGKFPYSHDVRGQWSSPWTLLAPCDSRARVPQWGPMWQYITQLQLAQEQTMLVLGKGQLEDNVGDEIREMRREGRKDGCQRRTGSDRKQPHSLRFLLGRARTVMGRTSTTRSWVFTEEGRIHSRELQPNMRLGEEIQGVCFV